MSILDRLKIPAQLPFNFAFGALLGVKRRRSSSGFRDFAFAVAGFLEPELVTQQDHFFRGSIAGESSRDSAQLAAVLAQVIDHR